MDHPKPLSEVIDFNGKTFSFKCYLKSHSFSYRCKNHYSLKCPFLLTIPVNEENYSQDYKCIGTKGAFQASLQGHNERCLREFMSQTSIQSINLNSTQILPISEFSEWQSDLGVLRAYIRQNLSVIPSSIDTAMKAMKQDFSKKVIKEEKKNILNEIFPKDSKIAFHPSNCKIINGKDNSDDNLFKAYTQIMIDGKKKNEPPILQEHYIFASRLMLFQLSETTQWFIDGTFSVAPSGYIQLLVIMVYIPSLKIFYPACYILLTGKSEKLYLSAFQTLRNILEEEELVVKPELIMMDFEIGMQNAVKKAFKLSDKNIVGCYFHYVKAIITKAQKLGILKRKQENPTAKTLIGLLKILSHCPLSEREDMFAEIENIYKGKGKNYEAYLKYFRKTWLRNDFLEGLFKSYKENSNINFIRTNNPCEIFNKYLGNFFFLF